MAISGHKTLTEVQRYTKDADRKRLADSGMAKLRGQSENSNVTNIEPPLHKHGSNLLKTKGGEMTWRSLGESNPCFSLERAVFSRESARGVVSADPPPTTHIEADQGNQPTPASSRPARSRTCRVHISPTDVILFHMRQLPLDRVRIPPARFVEQGRDGRPETRHADLLLGVAKPAQRSIQGVVAHAPADRPTAGNTYSPCPVKRRSSRRITIAWCASKGYRRRPIARATNLLARRSGPTLRGSTDTTCVSSQHEI